MLGWGYNLIKAKKGAIFSISTLLPLSKSQLFMQNLQ